MVTDAVKLKIPLIIARCYYCEIFGRNNADNAVFIFGVLNAHTPIFAGRLFAVCICVSAEIYQGRGNAVFF